MGSYLALGYCWGGVQEHATTTTTIEEYIQEIPRESIPETISGAIYATRKLGIKHLGVDSYCILQDSLMDIETELAKMSSISRIPPSRFVLRQLIHPVKGSLKNEQGQQHGREKRVARYRCSIAWVIQLERCNRRFLCIMQLQNTLNWTMSISTNGYGHCRRTLCRGENLLR